MNLNKVFLIGRLTQDPESRSTPSGQTVTTINMATNRVWNAPDGRKEPTEYHRVVAWGRLGEVASNYLKKGGMVLIEGRLQTRSWEDKTGNKRYTTEIIAEGLQLGPRSASQSAGSYSHRGESSSTPMADIKRPAATANGTEPEIPIIDENEPLRAGVESGVDEDEMKIKESDLPF